MATIQVDKYNIDLYMNRLTEIELLIKKPGINIKTLCDLQNETEMISDSILDFIENTTENINHDTMHH